MLLTGVNDAERCSFLTSTTGTTGTVGIVLNIVRQSVVDDMCQIIYIQPTRCHIGGNQQLNGMLAELLHRQVTLLLRQVTMQRLSIIPIANQFVGNLLCLQLRTAEYNGEDAGIIVYQPLQGKVFVLGIHHIIDVVHMLCTLVAASYHDFLIVMQITFGNAFYLLAHRRREKQRVALCGHSLQDRVNALGESHVQHLISLIKNHIIHIV